MKKLLLILLCLPLFFSSCKKEEEQPNTNNSSNLEIGDFYQGGVIFYLDGNGGGLIAAPFNQSDAAWGCYGTNINGAEGADIGTGSQNTIDIEAGCTTVGTAADVCANLTLNGYSDWFLPSRFELREMWENKWAINYTAEANGGEYFSNSSVEYWSSTEYVSNDEYFNESNSTLAIPFNQAYTATVKNKGIACYVRAIRSF